MKKIALVFCAVVSLFSEVNAMNAPQQEAGSQQRVPAKVFTVNTVPPVEVIQIPSENKIILDGGIIAPFINIDCKTYNEIRVNKPIDLKYDMTKEQMIASLTASFGEDKKVDFFDAYLQ